MVEELGFDLDVADLALAIEHQLGVVQLVLGPGAELAPSVVQYSTVQYSTVQCCMALLAPVLPRLPALRRHRPAPGRRGGEAGHGVVRGGVAGEVSADLLHPRHLRQQRAGDLGGRARPHPLVLKKYLNLK